MRETEISSDLDFFFGCGSSTVRLLCFDRTGTRMVVREGLVGSSDSGRGSGCGSVWTLHGLEEWADQLMCRDVRSGDYGTMEPSVIGEMKMP